jgi:hypothetical protein
MLAMDYFVMQEYPAARQVLLEEAERRAEALNVAACYLFSALIVFCYPSSVTFVLTMVTARIV